MMAAKTQTSKRKRTMKDILFRGDFEPQMADVVAKALISAGHSEEGYGQYSVSRSFIAESLLRENLDSESLYSLVARTLNREERRLFLARKDLNRNDVVESFLEYNQPTRLELETLLNLDLRNEAVYWLVHKYSKMLTEAQFERALNKCLDMPNMIVGWVFHKNLNTNLLEKVIRHVLCKDTRSNDLTATVLGDSLRLIGVLHPQVLDVAEKLFEKDPETYAEAYLGAVSSGTFQNTETFEKHLKHLRNIENRLKVETNKNLNWMFTNVLKMLIASPRVSFQEASKLYTEFNARVGKDVHTRSTTIDHRETVLNLGFDVYRGNFEDMPEELHEGFRSLVLHNWGRINPVMAAYAIKTFPDKTQQRSAAENCLAPLMGNEVPWIIELLNFDSDDMQYCFRKWYVETPKHLQDQREHDSVSVKENPFLGYAAQKLGLDFEAWKTLIVLGKDETKEENIPKFVDLVLKLQ